MQENTVHLHKKLVSHCAACHVSDMSCMMPEVKLWTSSPHYGVVAYMQRLDDDMASAIPAEIDERLERMQHPQDPLLWSCWTSYQDIRNRLHVMCRHKARLVSCRLPNAALHKLAALSASPRRPWGGSQPRRSSPPGKHAATLSRSRGLGGLHVQSFRFRLT